MRINFKFINKEYLNPFIGGGLVSLNLYHISLIIGGKEIGNLLDISIYMIFIVFGLLIANIFKNK